MPRSLLLLAATAAAAPYACEIQHAFGAAAAYARRSTLTVDPERANHNKLKFAPDSMPLVGANATAFADLVKADGVYRIRVRREGARAWASASIRACDLAASGYEEDLSVQLDARGDVVACVEIKVHGAFVLSPPRRPPRHRRDACSMGAMSVPHRSTGPARPLHRQCTRHTG